MSDAYTYRFGRIVRVRSGPHRGRFGFVTSGFVGDRLASDVWLSASERPPTIAHCDLEAIPEVPLVGRLIAFNHAQGDSAIISHTAGKGEIVLALISEDDDGDVAWRAVDHAIFTKQFAPDALVFVRGGRFSGRWGTVLQSHVDPSLGLKHEVRLAKTGNLPEFIAWFPSHVLCPGDCPCCGGIIPPAGRE